MRTATYNDLVRDFVSMSDAMNRAFAGRPYDYARNGGSNAGNSSQARKRKGAVMNESQVEIRSNTIVEL